jgi:monoamine oxidase
VERGRRSLEDFLEGLGGDLEAAASVRARLFGTCAVPLEEVSLAVAEELLRPEGAGPTRRLATGAQSLAEAVADRLADVRVERLVRVVEHDDRGVRVLMLGRRFEVEADAAVLAVPAPILRSLTLRPPLPGTVAQALAALAIGDAGKLAVALEAPPALTARQSVDPPFWWWTALGEDGEARRCVTLFAPSAEAPWEHDVEADLLRRLLAFEPSVRMIGAMGMRWGGDPYTMGAYTAIPPGAPGLLDALERPFGRVVLAGEHAAGLRWHGTLEGAIRSGRRAAAQVLELLGRV